MNTVRSRENLTYHYDYLSVALIFISYSEAPSTPLLSELSFLCLTLAERDVVKPA